MSQDILNNNYDISIREKETFPNLSEFRLMTSVIVAVNIKEG